MPKIKFTKQVTTLMKMPNNKMPIIALTNGEAIISGQQNPTMDKSKLNKPLIKLMLKIIYMVPLNFKMIKMLLIKQLLN